MKYSIAQMMMETGTDTAEKIGPAKCVCFRGWDAMWLVKGHAVVCSPCDEERQLPDEPNGIVVARCSCGAGKEATWFTTKDGSRVCSNCGERR